MNRVFLTAISLFIFTSFMCLNAQWVKSYGGSSFDRASSIWQTYDGGFVVLGFTQSFGEKPDYFWILKLFSDGEIEWQKIYGGSGSQQPSSIQQTLDGGYIVASSSNSFGAAGYSDFWILKLFPDGEIEWQKIYGGSDNDGANSIQQTSDGGYIVTGQTWSFDAGNSDFWILKLSPDGEIEWQKTYGGSESDGANSIQQTSDGGYIVTGTTGSFGTGNNDFWILKLESNGDIEWQKTYGGENNDSANSIQQTSDGGYIVAGSTSSFGTDDNSSDIWILKLYSDGDIEWQKSYRGGDAKSIQQAIDGGYIVTGQTRSFDAGNSDVWILKLSPAGDIEWQKKYGCGLDDHANSIKQTSDGGYIVAGCKDSFPSPDVWVFKLSSNGELHPSCDLIRTTDVVVTDTNASPEDTSITPQDTNIEPQETDNYPSGTNAIVYDFCSGKYILKIMVTRLGTTDPSPGTYTYYPGTKVKIKAIPSGKSTLSRWLGDASGDANTITITMDSHKSIEARFIPTDGLITGCFIATAAYGSLLHPYVETLRHFRDRYLITSKLGREVVNVYYKYSPYTAELIVKHKVLRIAVRINLLPLVVFSYSMVHFGPIVTAVIFVFIFMLPIFFIWFYRRK